MDAESKGGFAQRIRVTGLNFFLQRVDDRFYFKWKRSAVGIAQNNEIRAAFKRSRHSFHRVGFIVLVTVEEMLGIVNNFAITLL